MKMKLSLLSLFLSIWANGFAQDLEHKEKAFVVGGGLGYGETAAPTLGAIINGFIGVGAYRPLGKVHTESGTSNWWGTILLLLEVDHHLFEVSDANTSETWTSTYFLGTVRASLDLFKIKSKRLSWVLGASLGLRHRWVSNRGTRPESGPGLVLGVETGLEYRASPKIVFAAELVLRAAADEAFDARRHSDGFAGVRLALMRYF